ncbi:MAG: arginine deiminase-related protein [Pseudomonadota bacterium]
MASVRYSKLLMVEPAAFGFNAQTAASNRFQQQSAPGADATQDIPRIARKQFASLVTALREAGATVCVARDSAQPVKPDAVFPNNWVSFHEDGTVVLYPMQSENRRSERSEAILEKAKLELGFVEKRRIDLTSEERHGRFLEGTGSLVLDRAARVAYACRSPRTDESLVRKWAQLMDYEPVLFDASGPDGAPVYHTNVLLWIGEHIAGIGLGWVAARDRDTLVAKLVGGAQRQLLQLDTRALQSFAGNMFEVPTPDARLLVMSAAAASALTEVQQASIRAAGCTPVIAAIPDIERLGGGSVRCMVAEVPFVEEGG